MRVIDQIGSQDDDDSLKILAQMYREIAGSNFRDRYRMLLVRMDGDKEVREHREKVKSSGAQ